MPDAAALARVLPEIGANRIRAVLAMLKEAGLVTVAPGRRLRAIDVERGHAAARAGA